MESITIKDDFIKLGQALKLAGLAGSGVDAKFMIEVKAANQTEQDDVLEKAHAGIKWCECASQVDADGKKWEYRMIPGDKISIGNTFKYVAGMAVQIGTEE